MWWSNAEGFYCFTSSKHLCGGSNARQGLLLQLHPLQEGVARGRGREWGGGGGWSAAWSPVPPLGESPSSVWVASPRRWKRSTRASTPPAGPHRPWGHHHHHHHHHRHHYTLQPPRINPESPSLRLQTTAPHVIVTSAGTGVKSHRKQNNKQQTRTATTKAKQTATATITKQKRKRKKINSSNSKQ